RRVETTRRRPVDDDAATGPEQGVDAVLGAEPDAPQIDVHDPVVLVHGHLSERSCRTDPGNVEDGVDASARVERGREHGLALILLRTVAPTGNDGVAELGGRLRLASADVGGENARSFAYEDPRRRSRHPGPGSGDHRDLAVELRHPILPMSRVA